MDINSELKVIGEYKSFPFMGPNTPGVPKYNTPLTPRENLFRFLKGEGMWTPVGTDFLFFLPRIIPDNVARVFVIDGEPVDYKSMTGGKDWFNVEWEYVPQAGGSMVRPGNPLLVPDLSHWEDYVVFPDLDALDWEKSAEVNRPYIHEDRIVEMWIFSGFFERLISFMEFENAALALIDEDEQEHVHRLFARLCDFYDKLLEKLHTYYNPALIYFHDDWGSQRAPFFSLNTVQEMIVPYLKRLCDTAHKYGIGVDLHSCVKIERLVPAMIEAGVDIWSGQPMNDRIAVLQEYGDRIKLSVSPAAEYGSPGDATPEAMEAFLRDYDPFWKSIVVSAGVSYDPKWYAEVYARSREAFSK